ncbi:WXG100 family type VII secretion target [Nocardia sp. NPDC057227]|uniref:WXG100 family type VII secretion target n=1 Tax=Nocardia sp. NPDC057227 TaxID=3346056 RepID=UPI00363BAAB6
MSTVRIDPEALRATQPSFDACAATITTAANQLTAALAAEGECWGNDRTGQAFAQNYTSGVEQGKTSVANLATTMTRLGANLVSIADQVTAQEDAVAAGLDRSTGR